MTTKEYKHENYLKNKEKIQGQMTKWRHDNPDARRIIVNRWAHANSKACYAKLKRHRLLGAIPINSLFPGSDGHHLNPEQVVYIPRGLHMGTPHNVRTGRGMAQINAIAYNFLFKQEADTAMGVINAH